VKEFRNWRQHASSSLRRGKLSISKTEEKEKRIARSKRMQPYIEIKKRRPGMTSTLFAQRGGILRPKGKGAAGGGTRTNKAASLH